MPRANSARTYHLITCDLSVPQDVGAPKDRQMFLSSVGRNAGPVENFTTAYECFTSTLKRASAPVAHLLERGRSLFAEAGPLLSPRRWTLVS